MPTVTVKLSESDAKLLEELRISDGKTKSKSEVIRCLLRSSSGVLPGNAACGDDVLGILQQQLTVKDEQIAALGEALLAAQETAKAAQLLQAAEKPAKLLGDDEQLSAWRRLKRWLRGE